MFRPFDTLRHRVAKARGAESLFFASLQSRSTVVRLVTSGRLKTCHTIPRQTKKASREFTAGSLILNLSIEVITCDDAQLRQDRPSQAVQYSMVLEWRMWPSRH